MEKQHRAACCEGLLLEPRLTRAELGGIPVEAQVRVSPWSCVSCNDLVFIVCVGGEDLAQDEPATGH